jgi:hypothetical protein
MFSASTLSDEKGEHLNRLLALLSLTVCMVCFGQPPQTARLAVPRNWSDISIKMILDSPIAVRFHLTTSWIPGPDHKGMFRYRMNAAPVLPDSIIKINMSPELYSPEAIDGFLKKLHDTRVIQIELYDADGFLVRNVPATLSFLVDDSGKVVALGANDDEPMDAAEYRTVEKGSWQISWIPEPLQR